jgi:hypothetical protein
VLLLAPTDPVPGAPWRRRDDLVGWAVFERADAPRPVDPPPPTVLPVAHALPVRPAALPFPPQPAPRAVAARPAAAAVPDRAPGTTAGDQELWAAWAAGRLAAAHDHVRERVFYEPGEPLWRFLNGAVLWEGGWLRRAEKEMQAASRLLAPMPPDASVRGLCTAGELASMIAFWSESRG